MASRTSNVCFARLASGALALALAATVVIGLRDQRADACGWSGPTIEDLTTFDPGVVRDPAWDRLHFDPFVAGFGGLCEDCARTAMLADWQGYLKDAVTAADWEQVLYQASTADLTAIAARLAGKTRVAPKGFERSTLWNRPAARKKLAAAIRLVALARRVEPRASLDVEAAVEPAAVTAAARLLTEARAGLKAARDPFLKQRHAFQVLRLLFYRRDWAGAIGFHQQQGGALAAPSSDLAWRARYYLAGALRRTGDLARANLELARVHVGSPALAGAAAQDFRPMEDVDWRQTLRLATSVREQTQLWRLVGMTSDGLVAAQEIQQLDPGSDLLGLLVVRELGRAESRGTEAWGGPPEPAAIAAQQKTYAALEQIASKAAATRGGDRPWLMQLVLGHLAARRGDLVTARAQLQAAVRARPGDVAVASQAKASLALALALDWKINPQREDELARAMNGLDPSFGRQSAVTTEVRGRLAHAYVQAGRIVDGELLRPGIVSPIDDSTGRPRDPKVPSKWAEVSFIKALIARTGQTSSEFDRFVLAGTHTRAALEQELALRYLLDGNFTAASQAFTTTTAASAPLGTDPFVTHIVDCHDCDHAKHANARWTHASLAARLAALANRASGKGEPAAQAALAIGTAYYNLTWYGNARTVLGDTHQKTFDTRPAERWYRRAFELSRNRELKARAAFYAAKAELQTLVTAKYAPYESADALPVPKAWFAVVKGFADTKYHREILKECGHYRRWVGASAER